MTIQLYATKIIKPLVCAIFMVSAYHIKVCAQTNSQSINVWFDKAKKEVVILNGTDSLGAVLFDKNFRATLNHKKKKKKRTIYFRFAQYATPEKITSAPIILSNENTLLHLQGILNGDTTTRFSCSFSLSNGLLLMKTEIIDLSVNELAFRYKTFPHKSMDISPTDLGLISNRKKKKHFTEIILHSKKDFDFLINVK